MPPDGGGYGAGLFDSSGPTKFAEAVGTISSKLTGVQTAFTTFGQTAQQSLSAVSKAVDDLVQKLGQVQSQVQGAGSGLITPGSPGWGNQTQPTAPSGGPMLTSNAGWTMANAPQPSGGPTVQSPGPLDGMQENTAQGPTQFPSMQQGTASTMGQRAMQSMVPAAIGAATNAAGNMMSTAIQGVTVGDILGPIYGVSGQSLYKQPKGWLSQNAGQYAQAAYYAQQNLGVSPGGAPGSMQAQNWQNIMGNNGTIQQMMMLQPGLQVGQAAQAANQMLQAPSINMQIMAGFGNLYQGGKIPTAGALYQEMFQKWGRGNITPNMVNQEMRPGGLWSTMLTNLGMGPGTDAFAQAQQYFTMAASAQAQGKPLPDPSKLRNTQLGNNPAFTQLQATGALSSAQQGAEPALAAAADTLNKAATALYNAVGPFSALLGGSGPGGLVGSAVSLGGMYLGGKAVSKIGGKVLGKVGGKIGGMFGGKLGSLFGRGGATAAEDVAGGASKGGLLSNLLKGGLGGLFRGGATAAGEDVAVTGGLEAAGAAADATGVGLPVGLALGAAGLAAPFAIKGISSLWKHHRGAVIGTMLGGPLGGLIGQVGASGIEKGIGSVGKAAGGILGSAGGAVHDVVGGLFGGLFGHHHKKSTTGTADTSGDVASLLGAKPKPNTLIHFLTTPIKKSDNTLAAVLFSPLTPAGGAGSAATLTAALTGAAGTAGAAGGTGGGAGAPYNWTSPSSNVAAANMSSLVNLNKSGTGSSTSSSGTSNNGGPASPGTVAPSGNVATWIQKAMQVAGVSGAAWTNGLATIIQHESGGNPNAINLTDSNAKAGHPSQGLMQLIPSNFTKYSMPGYNTNIDDPVSNIIAGIGYINATYHGINNVPGIEALAKGQGYVGYARGSQLIDRTQLAVLHKGESVITAANNYSTSPYNTGGAANANGGGSSVYLNFKAGSVVLQVPASSSQQDMEKLANQFVAAISKPQVLAGVRST